MELKREEMVYVEGIPHIKAKVLLLPTKSYSDIQLQMSDKLHFENGISIALKSYQHFYFVSDEELKTGDDFLTNQNGAWELQKCQKVFADGTIMSYQEEIAMFQEDTYFTFNPENCKKIIATTNTLLNSGMKHGKLYNVQAINTKYQHISLPQPSKQFIEKYIEEYNKGNVITDIFVEYKQGEWFTEIDDDGGNSTFDYVLKVSPDNTVTIATKKQKDSWSRDEVIEFAKLAIQINSGKSISTGFKWIEENLN